MQGAAQTGRCEGASMLPVELTLAILALSASSHSTAHARNICLVSRAVYNHCWPCLHRIVGLRNARELKTFSEHIHQPACTPGDEAESARLKIRQDSLRFLYLNNNKDTMGIKELQTDERPDMWMMSILLAAKNLEVMHVEEYWSISYPCVRVWGVLVPRC